LLLQKSKDYLFWLKYRKHPPTLAAGIFAYESSGQHVNKKTHVFDEKQFNRFTVNFHGNIEIRQSIAA